MDTDEIRRGILNKYRQVAGSPAGAFRYPVGEQSALDLGYSAQLTGAVPVRNRARFVGVGNPFALGPIRPGAAVLDLGCGAGFDALVAALVVGPAGRVVGCDLSPDMLTVAREGREALRLPNIEFIQAYIEELPFASSSFDIALSNGVLNLVPDKPKAFREICRTLKSGGRLQACDMSLVGDTPPPDKSRWSD
jgi:arsenite methyltransferase